MCGEVPITVLHYPIAYFLYHLLRKNPPLDNAVSLPGLVVGSTIPDVEILVVLLVFQGAVPHRVVLHSLVGAATVGTFLAIMFVRGFYPPLVSRLFSLDRNSLALNCRVTSGVVGSCLVGAISHVFLDFVNHDFNAILWPFIPNIPSPISIALGGVEVASLLTHVLLGGLLGMILVHHRSDLWENLLVG